MYKIIYCQKNVNFQYYTGNWLLRSTNNPYYKEGNTRLQIDNDGTLCFRTKQTSNIWCTIRKKNGIYKFNENNNILEIQFNSITYYKYSLFGIKIPKLDQKILEYNGRLRLKCSLESYDTIYLYDYNKKHHYIFDLYIEELKIPKIETTINNFLFIQIISFLIDTTLTISLRHTILNNLM